MNYAKIFKFAKKFSRASNTYEDHLTSRLNSEEGVTVIMNELEDLSKKDSSRQETEDKIINLKELLHLAVDDLVDIPMSIIDNINDMIKIKTQLLDVWKVYEHLDNLLSEIKTQKNPVKRLKIIRDYNTLLVTRSKNWNLLELDDKTPKPNSITAEQLVTEIANKIRDLADETKIEIEEYTSQKKIIDALGDTVETATNLKNKAINDKILSEIELLEASVTNEDLLQKLSDIKTRLFYKMTKEPEWMAKMPGVKRR